MNRTRCHSLTIFIAVIFYLLNAVTTFPVSNSRIEPLSKHVRVKRQYFKPSIDGSWIANERSLLLKHSKMPAGGQTTTTTTASSVALAYKSAGTETSSSSSSSSSTSTPAKSEVTVHSLAHSLINLFDRIKHTLCK